MAYTVGKVFELCKLVLYSSCAPNSMGVIMTSERHLLCMYGYTTNSVIWLYKRLTYKSKVSGLLDRILIPPPSFIRQKSVLR